ncbi:MAG: wax ester/triacylglycerol synthase family O-acyltransferase [Thermoanaerobaculia bacterium]
MSASPKTFQEIPLPLRPGEKGIPLTAIDIAWLRMDDPTNLMHVHGVFPLAGDVTWEQASKPFAERMAKIPRFGQRVARDEAKGGKLVWVDDSEFDLHRHLTEGRIDEPGDDAALARAVELHFASRFDRAHPLWEFHLLHGYRGGSALFARVHHAIGDGIALMLVILALFDLTPDGTPAIGIPKDVGASGNPFLDLLLRPAAAGFAAVEAALARIMPETLRLMKGPAEAFAKVHPIVRGVASTGSLGRLIARPSDPITAFKGPLGVEKRVAWTDKLPLEEVRQLGRQLGGTINDVLNTAMAGGLRRYLARTGTPPESLGLRAAMPVSLRPISEMADMGNRFGLIFLKMPVGMSDPLRRLEEFRKRSAALKRSTEPLVVYSLLQAAGALPEFVHSLLLAIFATKATAVFTNVPGPTQTLYFAGQALKDIYFWVPQAGHLGLGVSILSYDGGVRMGVGTDAGLVPDPGRIVDGFHAEFEALQKAAAKRS